MCQHSSAVYGLKRTGTFDSVVTELWENMHVTLVNVDFSLAISLNGPNYVWRNTKVMYQQDTIQSAVF
jgi:hypothetical protein